MIVGWSLGTTLRTEMPLEALEMALRRRGRALEGLVHHSDSEYVHTGFLAWSDPHSDRRERMCGAVCPPGGLTRTLIDHLCVILRTCRPLGDSRSRPELRPAVPELCSSTTWLTTSIIE